MTQQVTVFNQERQGLIAKLAGIVGDFAEFAGSKQRIGEPLVQGCQFRCIKTIPGYSEEYDVGGCTIIELMMKQFVEPGFRFREKNGQVS